MLEDLVGLGLDVQDVNAIQMALRTVLIYAATLAIVRVGSKRFLSQATAFDAIVAAIAYSSDWFGTLVKGEPVLLIKDGKVYEKGIRGSSVSHKDLEEALRIESHVTDPERVQLAYLERNGGISVIPRKPEPRVLEVSVEDGVQTVRIVV